MLHPRLAAREAVEEEGAHDAPAKAGAVGDRLVDLPGGGNPVVDEVQGLPPYRFEEAVRDERVDLGVEHEGVHADRSVEAGGPSLRLFGGGFAPDHLDEGQQVDGDEGVADEHSLRRRAVRLEAAREEPRGRGGDDRVGGRGPARASEEGALHLLALGRALLNEGRPRDRLLDARHHVDAPGRHGRGESEPGVGAGRVLQRLVDPGAGARVRVVDPDVDAVHREPRRPSGSRHPGAEEGDSPDFAHPAALDPAAYKPLPRSPIRRAAAAGTGVIPPARPGRGCASYRASQAERSTRPPRPEESPAGPKGTLAGSRRRGSRSAGQSRSSGSAR